MRCALLSVGTELLMGQVVDTNSVYLAQKLNRLGFDVMYKYTVGDNDGRLGEVIRLAFADCDMVITTGGLGPTEDDITKEVVTEVMGDVLVEHAPTIEALKSIDAKRKIKLTQNNYKQAMMPSTAVVFDTDKGTAPGFAIEKNGKIAICMPGPPGEMTRMFERRVEPYLKTKQDSVIYHRDLRIFGRGESRIEVDLLDLIDAQTDPTIATYAKAGECSVRVASKRATLEEAMEAVKPVCDEIKARIGDYIFSDDDEELVQVVGRKLIERGISISSAESCTGGKFAEQLTSVPGISAVFERGLVTYAYSAKMDELGVSAETLEKETAISPEVARQMAEGLYKKTGSDVCISVTGNAGPDASDGKPVGLMYFGCVYKGETSVYSLQTLMKDREWNRRYAVLTMLDIVNRKIDGREVRVDAII